MHHGLHHGCPDASRKTLPYSCSHHGAHWTAPRGGQWLFGSLVKVLSKLVVAPVTVAAVSDLHEVELVYTRTCLGLLMQDFFRRLAWSVQSECNCPYTLPNMHAS